MTPDRTEYSDLPEATPQDAGKTLPEAVIPEPSPYEGLQAQDRLDHDQHGVPYYAPDVPDAEKSRWQNDQPAPGYSDGGNNNADSRGRICGLSRWLFFLLIAIAVLVVVGAAVGGGVGGALAGRNDKDAAAATTTASAGTSATATTTNSATASQDATTSDVPATTTSSTVSISSTTIVGPSASSLVRDCPSVNNTIYSYGSSDSPMLFRRLCGMSLKNIGGADIVNQPVRTLESCIDLCGSYNTRNASGISAGTSQPCNAVCWRNTFNTDFPGQCFGFTTQNSSGTFTITQPLELQCDSAGWINQSF